MAFSVVVSLSAHTCRRIQNHDAADVFGEELVTLHREQLLILLNQYARLAPTPGRVYNFTLIDNSMNFTSDTDVAFDVAFGVDVFFACSDIRRTFDQTMRMTVRLDCSAKSARITGEYVPPSREPDEL